MSDTGIANTTLLKVVDETLRFQLVGKGSLELAGEHRTNWVMPHVDVVSFLPQGSGKIMFRDSGETCPIGQGEAMLSPGGLVRKNLFIPQNGKLVIIWAHLKYEIMRGFNPIKLFRAPAVLKGSDAMKIGRALEKINSPEDNRQKRSAGSIAREKALGMELFAILADGCGFRDDANELLHQYRTQSDVMGHIEDHLAEKITVEELAKISRLSVSRFHRVFKNATGHSPTDFIIDRRVQRAKQMLSTTPLSLSEIAEAAGFGNSYYFSRMFKRFAGLSPSAYRESASGEAVF